MTMNGGVYPCRGPAPSGEELLVGLGRHTTVEYHDCASGTLKYHTPEIQRAAFVLPASVQRLTR